PNGFGLWGHPSSSQSAIIVPLPGSDSIYYIFTTEAFGISAPRFSYSIVNMNLSGGLGDVIVKNILINQSVSEQLSAVRHSNGIDYWIIVHEFGSNGFKNY